MTIHSCLLCAYFGCMFHVFWGCRVCVSLCVCVCREHLWHDPSCCQWSLVKDDFTCLDSLEKGNRQGAFWVQMCFENWVGIRWAARAIQCQSNVMSRQLILSIANAFLDNSRQCFAAVSFVWEALKFIACESYLVLWIRISYALLVRFILIIRRIIKEQC